MTRVPAQKSRSTITSPFRIKLLMDVEVAATWRFLLEFSSVRDAGSVCLGSEKCKEREREVNEGKGWRKGRAALYFSCVVIKVYYANEIMSASLFYRG